MTAKLCGLNNAKYADKKSSMSTSAGTKNTHISTHISQTSQLFLKNRGYIAREVMDGRPCDKSDTYAFGVVIFEVCTRLLAFDETRRLGACLTEHIERLSDKGGGFSLCDDTIPWHKEIYNKLFSLAEQCTDDRKQSRPKMSLVYNQLVDIQKDVKSNHYPTNDDTDDDEEFDSSLSLHMTDGRRSTTPTEYSYYRAEDYRQFHSSAVAGYPVQSLYTAPPNNPSYPVSYHHAASSVPAVTQATVRPPQYPNSVPSVYLVGTNTPVEHSEFPNSNEPNQSTCYSLPLRIPAITHEAIEHTDNSALEERQQTNEPGLLHASHSDTALSSDMSELSFTSIRSPNPSGYSNDVFTHISGTSNNVLGRQPASSLSSDPMYSSNYENEVEYEDQYEDAHDYVNDYFAQQGEESLDENLLAAFVNLPTKE